MHEVLRVIDERMRTGSRPGNRRDGLRVVLAIEGGGMRGTVSAGMAMALHELGLMPAFDAVYGASAGAITGAWLLSSEPERLRGWTRPDYARTLIRWSAVLRRQPVVDVRWLIEVAYESEFPMDFASILASPVEYHPLATDAVTGESTDLRPLIADPVELRLALRASASLPFLAGPPVRLRDRRFYDAGVAEPIPFRTPLAQGATHVLVLRSRRPLALASTRAVARTPAVASTSAAAAALATATTTTTGTTTTTTGTTTTTTGTTTATTTDAAADAAAADAAAADAAAADAAAADAAAADATTADAAAADAAAAVDTSAAGDAVDAVIAADAVATVSAAPAVALPAARPPRSIRFLNRTTLRKESPELRTALLTRSTRTAADVARIAELEVAGQALMVFPLESVPPVSRLTTDGPLLAAAFESGRQAFYAICDWQQRPDAEFPVNLPGAI